MPGRTVRVSSKKRFTITRKNTPFNTRHFKSNDGMLTAVWGPGMWHYLHTMSFNYPVNPTREDKIHYRNFLLQLKHVLPCGKCRQNLTKNFQRLPLKWSHMESRCTFSKYVYNLHELINRMLNKKSGLTYAVVRERYEHFRARCATYTPIVENGCVEPLYGEKSKCILKIVPDHLKCNTFEIDKHCIKRKLKTPKNI